MPVTVFIHPGVMLHDAGYNYLPPKTHLNKRIQKVLCKVTSGWSQLPANCVIASLTIIMV